MRISHRWRQKSKHQQICAVCGQVKRWNGFRWLYRKQGQLVRERPACKGERTDSERYAELRNLVEAWQAKREDALLIDIEPQPLTDAANDLATWRHR